MSRPRNARPGGPRRSQRGAETLEFLGALPLVGLLIAIGFQGVALARQGAEAEADARALARQAVLCPDVQDLPAITTIDPEAAGATVRVTHGGNGLITVRVDLRPASAIADVDLRAAGIPAPTASVTMRHEPC